MFESCHIRHRLLQFSPLSPPRPLVCTQKNPTAGFVAAPLASIPPASGTSILSPSQPILSSSTSSTRGRPDPGDARAGPERRRRELSEAWVWNDAGKPTPLLGDGPDHNREGAGSDVAAWLYAYNPSPSSQPPPRGAKDFGLGADVTVVHVLPGRFQWWRVVAGGGVQLLSRIGIHRTIS